MLSKEVTGAGTLQKLFLSREPGTKLVYTSILHNELSYREMEGLKAGKLQCFVSYAYVPFVSFSWFKN